MNYSEIKGDFELIAHSPLVSSRIVLMIAEYIWFITLMWIGDTFQRVPYSGMASVMPEYCWAYLFLFMAMTQSYLLLSKNYHTLFSVIYSGFNAFVWIFVSVSFYISVTPPTAATSGETALVIGACWIFIRTGFITKRKIIDS